MSFEKTNEEILSRLDIRAEYAVLGVTGFKDPANSKGWLPCNAYGREQRTPSAGINVGDGPARGYYHNFSGLDGGHNHLFDFASSVASRFKDWAEARRHYAHKAGVQLSRGRQKERAEDKFDFTAWSDPIARHYTTIKRGITVVGMRRAGCKMAVWPKGAPRPSMLFAAPIYGPQLTSSEPVGFLGWSRTGGMIEVFKGKGVPPDLSKTITPRLPGTTAVWVGIDCHSIEDAELVWKVEGITDMLALLSLMPEDYWGRHVVVTNANGCKETPNTGHLSTLEGKRTIILHDADEPGQSGAATWLAALSRVAPASNVTLPYMVEPSQGKDLRDWILDGHTYEELLAMASSAAIFNPNTPAPSNERQQQKAVAKQQREATAAGSDDTSTAIEIYNEAILARVGLEVVGEVEDGGTENPIVVHSHHLRKTTHLSRIDYQKLIQCGGVPIHMNVREPGSKGEDNDGKIPFAHVRDAILLMASTRRIKGGMAQIGAGLFRGRTPEGHPNESLLFINSQSAYMLNGTRQLEVVDSLRAEGRVIEFGTTASDWFDGPALAEAIDNAQSVQWRRERIKTLDAIFAQWNWTRNTDPSLLSGLVLATWAQSIIPWRPWVCISGASNTGKTTLMRFLTAMFGEDICFAVSDTTEAGMCQTIQNKSMVILLDEFELNKNRPAIYAAFRGSSRGGGRARGTSSHKANNYTYFHLPWMAAIELGEFREADQNRAVKFELNRIDHTRPFSLPSLAECRQLGIDLLAIAATCVLPACDHYESLKTITAERGIPQRLVESLGIATAILSESMGYPFEDAKDLLRMFLSMVDAEEYNVDDANDLLADIIGASVDIGRGERKSVAEILCAVEITKSDNRDAMERQGVGTKYEDNNPYLFVSSRVKKTLLRYMKWDSDGFDIRQLLRRLPGAKIGQCRLADQRARGVLIPWQVVERHLDVRQSGEDY